MKLLKNIGVAMCLMLGAAITAVADIKITTKNTMGGTSYEGTTYIKGVRQRTEQKMTGYDVADIMQCDRKRNIKLNNGARRYMIEMMEDATQAANTPAQPAGAAQAAPADAPRRGGVVTYTTTITDTGERKKMFGLTARHLKTSMVAESSPDACSQTNMKIETDGWYVDLQFGLDCAAGLTMRPPQTPNASGCRDQVRQRTVGGGKLDFPALVTTTIYSGGNSQTFTSTQEITDLSMTTLDAALFDVPAGYTEAKDYQEFMGMNSTTAMMNDAVNKAASGETGIGTATAAAPAVAAKSPDSIRIGVVSVNNRTDRPLSENALRDRLINYINEAGLDAITLAGGTPAEVSAEAKAKQCDYLLYTDVTNVKQSTAGKIGGFLGRVSSVPTGGGGKYEARVEFRLLATSTLTPVYQSNASSKEGGGEEGTVFSVLEKEAQMIAAEAKKKK